MGDAGPHGRLGSGESSGESAGISYFTPLVAGPFVDIASDAAGNAWFTHATSVARITPAGVVTEFHLPLGDAGGQGATYITRGADGNMWISRGTSKVDRVTPSGEVTEFTTNVTFGTYFELTSGADGNLWFPERDQGKVGRLTPSGIITEYDVGNAHMVPLIAQVADSLAASASGDIWFPGNWNWTATSSSVLEKQNASSGQRVAFPVHGYTSIALDANGEPWFTDATSDANPDLTLGTIEAGAVRRFRVACPSSAQSTSQGNYGVVATGAGNHVWFTESRFATLGRIDTATLDVACFHAFGGVATAGFRGYPERIAPAPDGSVWFTESYAIVVNGGFPHGSSFFTVVIGHLVP